MDAQQFCYWLQGFAELNNGVPPNEMQWKAIRDHLSLVFNKVTPSYPNINSPSWINPTPTTVSPFTVTCSSPAINSNNSMAVC